MSDDRSEFSEARTAGLRARHETREARAAIWNPSFTYAPDATECANGHQFTSEADCILPEGWDQFMCRTCINEALQADPLPRGAEGTPS